MSFTDDDLKRLKEHLAGDTVQLTWYAPVTRDNLQALLARLEAAEKMADALKNISEREHFPLCEGAWANDPRCVCVRGVAFGALIAWRKAAGR